MIILGLTTGPAWAEERITAGVAYAYMPVFKELAKKYAAANGIHIGATFGTSGGLYTQIANGAPYAVFLSADALRPERLHKEGIAHKPFTYAVGKVILWSAKSTVCGAPSWQEAFRGGKISRLAVTNPALAPYGAAAVSVLREAGLWEGLEKKVVTGQNIAQTFRYASTEAVDAAFAALSLAMTDEGRKGCWYDVPEAPPVLHQAVIVKSKDSPAVRRFVEYLISPEAVAINRKYGYE